MKLYVLFLSLLFLLGCASSGYNPHYIVSDTLDEEIIIPAEESFHPTSSSEQTSAY